MQKLLRIGGIDFEDMDSYTINESPVTNESELENGGKFVEVLKNRRITISGSYESELIDKISTLETALKQIPCYVILLDTETQLTINKNMKYTSVSKVKKFHKYNTSCWGISFELEEI